VDRAEALRRLAEARVGRLATVRPDGTPHVIPFVFAADPDARGSILYWAVDRKPKATPELQRLANIRANPVVEVVVDHYEEDWSKVWWVRARGLATVVPDGSPERDRALALLAARFAPYADDPPPGPVVAIRVTSVSGWSASDDEEDGGRPP